MIGNRYKLHAFHGCNYCAAKHDAFKNLVLDVPAHELQSAGKPECKRHEYVVVFVKFVQYKYYRLSHRIC